MPHSKNPTEELELKKKKKTEQKGEKDQTLVFPLYETCYVNIISPYPLSCTSTSRRSDSELASSILPHR